MPDHIELRIRIEGECDHGPKGPGELHTECRHVIETDWGDITYPDPRPERGQVGHLMLIGRDYYGQLIKTGPRRRADGGIDTAEIVHVEGDGPDAVVRPFLHLDHGRRWTWELFTARWFDGDNPTVFIGRWPD